MSDNTHPASASQTARIILSWLFVAVPLAYGLEQTLQKVASLFS